jgi:hypothetical protein
VPSVSDFISRREAWNRIANILFPDEEVTSVTERDAWLIGRYLPPGQDVSSQRDPWLIRRYWPSVPEVLFLGKQAPEALCAEVDRAYYRLSLEERIAAWFQAEGFDLSAGCALSRSDFEAHLPLESAKAAAPTVLRRTEMGPWVKQYLQTPKPTVRGARAEWAKIHGASDREALDAEVRKQAKKLGIPLRPGRRAK